MSPRRTGLPDLKLRRPGVRVAGRHQIRAQAAARHLGRPDTYRGEKLALGVVLLPIAAFATIHLATQAVFLQWQSGFSDDLPLALKRAIKTPVHYPPPLALPRITKLAFMTPPPPSKRLARPTARLRIARQRFPVPLSLPERVLPPLPKLKILVLYPPPLALPRITELAFMTPPLPSQRMALPAARLSIARQRFPVPLSLPERVLPPLPKFKMTVLYPPALTLPRITELAFMTPPLPSKRLARPAARLPITAQRFPVPLSLPERVLPPLPKFKMTVLYPPPLALPRITELAFMTPPLPSKRVARPAARLSIARQHFPVPLALPEHVLPPLPKFAARVPYPPRLVLPPITRPVIAASSLPRLPKPTPLEPTVAMAAPGPPGLANSTRGVCSFAHARSSAAVAFNAARGEQADAQIPVSAAGPGFSTSDPSRLPASPWPAMRAPGRTMPARILPEVFAPGNDQQAFGLRLVAAVKMQMRDMTYYNPAYIQIAYPMGDVPPVYGVCSDVVVRAYRQLGFDLQELIHRAGLGSGDTSIDHRRTKVLRQFFKVYADTLPITDYPEDYKPGDIVSYFRPFGQSSKFHIAIVSDDLAPSGRPYLLHNRAWGVQKEDALFADEISGHYRFSNLRQPLPAKRRRRGRMLIAASTRKRRAAKPRPPSIAKRAGTGARRRRLALCSPKQPLSVRLHVADLCSPGARKAMGLGMSGHLKR